ncbi:hypothetical protein [Emticicia fontis]
MSLTQTNWKAENYGQIYRLKLGLASKLSEQDFQTQSVQNTTFKSGQGWIFDKTKSDFDFGDLTVMQSTENGIVNDVIFKVIINNDLLKAQFDLPFRKLEGRLIVAEITTMNDRVVTVAPLVCTYEYKQAVTPGDVSKYEFTFRKVSYVNFDDYVFPDILSEEIGDIVVDSSTDGNIKLKVSRLPPYGWGSFTHQIGWSLLDDVSTVTNWTTNMDGTALLLSNVPNQQTIYIFVKGYFTPTVYKSKQYFVNVEKYTFTSNMIAIDPNKPVESDLEEYSGSNAARIASGATGTTVQSVQPDFIISFAPMFPQADPEQTVKDMRAFKAKGAKCVQVNIEFDGVFKSLSQYNETNADLLNKYFEKNDYLINAAKEFDNVIFRIIVNYDDSRYYFQERDETVGPIYTDFSNATFNLFTEIAQDQFGNPLRAYNSQGKGHGSLAVDSAKAKMKGFVQKVMDRYYPILGRKFFAVAVVTSAQQEAGADFGSYNYVGPAMDYPCEMDYHPTAISKFQDWCVTVRYPTLAAYNSAMGTSWTNKLQIQPPKVAVSTLQQMTTALLQAMYNTDLFTLWYKFQEKLMMDFQMECDIIIKGKNPDILNIFSPGSTSDALGAARKTYNYIKIGTVAQVLHTQNGFTNFNGTKIPAADMVRAFGGIIATELNVQDLITNTPPITDPTIVRNTIYQQAQMFRLNKGRILNLIVSSVTHPAHFNNMLDMVEDLYRWDANKADTFSEGPTMNVSLKALVKNYAAFNTNYLNLNPPTNEVGRVKIVMTDDL